MKTKFIRSEFLSGDALGDDAEAAAYTGLSTAYLRKLRLTGDGPRYAKLGRCVRHRRDWLDAWCETRARLSTTETS